MFSITWWNGNPTEKLSVEECEKKFGKSEFREMLVYHKLCCDIEILNKVGHEYLIRCILLEMAKDWMRDNYLFHNLDW